MAQNQDKKADKPQTRTRLNNEIAFRYGANANVRAPRRKPGQSSLTEDLRSDAEPELEETVEQQADQEAAAPSAAATPAAAEPKKSLFELPRKEPARPSLLGGGVDADAVAPSDTPGPGRRRR